jgi:hypothetical protein
MQPSKTSRSMPTTMSNDRTITITLNVDEAKSIYAALIRAQLREYKLATRSGMRSRCGHNNSEEHYAGAQYFAALCDKLATACKEAGFQIVV